MTNIFVAFDKGKKTKRHQEYSDYKGGRKPTPEEFLMQIPYIKEYRNTIFDYPQSSPKGGLMDKQISLSIGCTYTTLEMNV